LISIRILARSFASRLDSGSVEQEDLGIADDRAPHRHPLALATGQLLRLAVDQSVMSSMRAGFGNPARDLRPSVVLQPQPNDMFSATVMCG